MPQLSIIPLRAVADPNLTDADIRVLAAIGGHINWQTGRDCFASATTLAKAARVSRSTFFAAADRLIKAGYVTREHRVRENGSDTSSVYDVDLHGGVPPAGHPRPASRTPPVQQQPDTHNVPVNTSSSSGLVPEQYEHDLRRLLERVIDAGGETSSFVAEIRVATQGMHGKPLTPEQIGEAIRGYNANGAAINFKLFKTYLRKTAVADKVVVTGMRTATTRPWERKQEVEARDQRMNRDPDVLTEVNRVKVTKPDQWWEDILNDAKAAGRYVYPYAYDLITGANSK